MNNKYYILFMKKLFLIYTLFFDVNSLYPQAYNPGADIPIQHDTAAQWVAISSKVLNLTSSDKTTSLKKWYLAKIKNGTVAAYPSFLAESAVSYLFGQGSVAARTYWLTAIGRAEANAYSLVMPGLQTQDWLKGLSIELSPHRFPQEWYFYDPNMPSGDYNRYKARVTNLNLTADSCCGCDDADAFSAKQAVSYNNGKFDIYNILLSPLCARQTATPPYDWYPLCNVAYNDNPERKFPGVGKDVVLLNTSELDYDFSADKRTGHDSVLPAYGTNIGNLIYQDMLTGKLKPVDFNTNKPLVIKNLLTEGMPADTVVVFDTEDPEKILTYRMVQQQRNPADFNRIRIKQELYFDFANERLYSLVKSVILMSVFYGPDGKTIRGIAPYCRLK